MKYTCSRAEQAMRINKKKWWKASYWSP